MEDHASHAERQASGRFRRVAEQATHAAGTGAAAGLVGVTAAVWVVLGAATRFPRWWELCATVAVPFFTLLMLVLIQHTQNHDDRATQLKLDEIIRATQGATNRMMTVEDASPADLDRIRDAFRDEAEAAAPEQGQRDQGPTA